MTTVRVLIDAVGDYNAGDIVKDAPVGLVDIAKKEVRNAATGERIAEIVDDHEPDSDELKELKAAAKELKIPGYTKMNADELKEAIAVVGGGKVAE